MADGALLDWRDVRERHDWSVLFVGNGLSIHVCERFAYGALFEHASTDVLMDEDLALFDGTPNFERILGDLSTVMRVTEILDMDSRPAADAYDRIRRALGHAVREVHPRRRDLATAPLAAMRAELLRYGSIFTTNYDLILYWSMGAGTGERFLPFVDFLRWGNRLQFDPERARPEPRDIPVYFLHGALHLVTGSDGRTRKLKRTLIRTLLEQYGEPLENDPHARPLLVTEGTAHDKLVAIERNEYLSHALSRLRAADGPIVVFGSSLSAQDSHLVEALGARHDRPVAVSMRPRAKRRLAAAQADVCGRLAIDELLFFDSTTHPLGRPEAADVDPGKLPHVATLEVM